MISVIVPLFNCEKYIKRCIDSVLNQTYQDLELLIIDDGSIDCSASIVKQYKDNRIRLFRQINKGPSAARNVGLDNARGDFVCFLDSDDEYEPFFLNDLYNGFLRFNSDITIGLCKRRNAEWDGNPILRNEEKRNVDLNMILYERAETHVVCLFRSLVVKNVRYNENIKYSEDWLFYKESLLSAKTIAYVNSAGYLYWDNNQDSLAWSQFNYYNHINKAHSSIYAHTEYYLFLRANGINGAILISQSYNVLFAYYFYLYKNHIAYKKDDFIKECTFLKPYFKFMGLSKKIIYRLFTIFPRISFLIARTLVSIKVIRI